MSRPNLENEPTQLYRQFDAAGVLLYVGISANALHRQSQHAGKPWARDVVRVEIENHPSRRAAFKAETLAIRAEKPRYNRTGVARPWTPQIGRWGSRVRREYLQGDTDVVLVRFKGVELFVDKTRWFKGDDPAEYGRTAPVGVGHALAVPSSFLRAWEREAGFPRTDHEDCYSDYEVAEWLRLRTGALAA